MKDTVDKNPDWRVHQTKELKAAIRSADANLFATDAEVQAVFARCAKTPPCGAARNVPAKAGLRRGDNRLRPCASIDSCESSQPRRRISGSRQEGE